MKVPSFRNADPTLLGYAILVVALAASSHVEAQPRPDEVQVAPAPLKDPGCATDSPPAQPREPVFNACFKLPPGKRIVRLILKPDTEVPDFVGWISSITCRWFLMTPAKLSGKKSTVVAPRLLTVEESYGVFVAALASAGLTLEEAGKYQRVVEDNAGGRVTTDTHFMRLPLEKISLVAIASGTETARAVLRGPNGEAHIVKTGDVISSQRGRVEKILSDRVMLDLPSLGEGEQRTFVIAVVAEGDGRKHSKDDGTNQGGAVEQGIAPDARSAAAPARR